MSSIRPDHRDVLSIGSTRQKRSLIAARDGSCRRNQLGTGRLPELLPPSDFEKNRIVPNGRSPLTGVKLFFRAGQKLRPARRSEKEPRRWKRAPRESLRPSGRAMSSGTTRSLRQITGQPDK